MKVIYLRIYVRISLFYFEDIMKFTYNFSVVKGFQANREYYIGMVPLGLLSKLFHDEEDYILPEYRAQRCINEARIPEICDYILSNRNNYVFSALSASIDGDFEYVPSEIDNNIGVLKVDMNAVFLINDGQHRKAAIQAALKEDPSLSEETIAIVFFKDEGLERSQQMFADLNKHAVKSTMSLSTLYDDRDPVANAVKQVVLNIPFLNKYIDKEKDSLGKNSSKLFTLANFLRANKRIIKEDVISQDNQEFLTSFWTQVFSNISEWKQLEKKQLYKCDLKEDYILTLSVTLNAFGRLGKYFIDHINEMSKLKKLDNIDWTRINPEWQGRVISAQGKITNNEDSIIKICNYIKKSLGIALSKEEAVKENDIRR